MDWSRRLCDVASSGKLEARSASYRDQDVPPAPIEPGEVYRFASDLWVMSYAVADQTIYHSKEHPSHVLLPVMPR